MPTKTVDDLEREYLQQALGSNALPTDTIQDLRMKFYANPGGASITRTGLGSPEGVVTAPVGTIYSDSVFNQNAGLWYKRSGSGNTGWIILYGDTGWRTITSWTSGGAITGQALSASFAPVAGQAGAIRTRRLNDEIYVGIRNLSRVDSTVISVWAAGYVLPQGFRPSVYAEGQFYAPTGPVAMWLGTDGSVGRGTGIKAGVNGDFAGTAEGLIIGLADNALWPTGLPGF